MIEITLEWYELSLAASVGVRRQIEAFRTDRKDVYGAAHMKGGRGWHLHIEGAAGEMAVAKALGRYWNGSTNTFKSGGDVGGVQVRTRSKHEYELIVRPEDRDGDWFVLVTGCAPVLRVHGYIRGAEAKRPEWLHEHGGMAAAHFVPHEALTALR